MHIACEGRNIAYVRGLNNEIISIKLCRFSKLFLIRAVASFELLHRQRNISIYTFYVYSPFHLPFIDVNALSLLLVTRRCIVSVYNKIPTSIQLFFFLFLSVPLYSVTLITIIIQPTSKDISMYICA